MNRVGAELEALLTEAVRNATHTHNRPYGRALLIEEILHIIERELADPRYTKQERLSARRITLEAMNHGRRLCE
ncbi:hypothetical protein [Nocardia wallacei]|uniref:hypothetical protein n=1 Tax=Nocardia wallacei TaxID=480035 RepID=UPI002454A492|nr:hypothetical protein [Nocardia wallacei]